MPRKRSMPASVYNRAIFTVRDYPRMVYEYDKLSRSLGAKAAASDGMPKSAAMGSNVEEKAIRLADLEADINSLKDRVAALEKATEGLNTSFASLQALMQKNNIVHSMRFPLNEYAQLVPSLRTWQREKQLFVVRIAHDFRFY